MNKGVVKRLFKYLKPYKIQLTAAFLCAIATVVLTLLGPVLVGRAIDQIIGMGRVNFDAVFTIVITLLFTILGVAVFQWLLSLCVNKISFNVVRDMRKQLFAKLNDVPLSFIDTHSHGDLISRIVNDIDVVGDGLLQVITQLFSGVITILGTLVFMAVINIQITIVVVIVTPLSLFVAWFIAKLSNKTFKEQAVTQGEIGGYIEEYLGNQRVVKTFCYEQQAETTFKEINQRLYVCGKKAQFASSLANPSTRFVNAIVYASVGVIGAIGAVNGMLTVGQVACFLTYANQYTKPFNEITGVITQLQTAIAGAKRYFETMDTPNQGDDVTGKIQLTKCVGKIDIKNVCFGYTPEQRLIKNFNLSVKPGERIAIVGPTGCGKTTLINLLMRFYDVTSGEIRVDDVNIKDVTRNSLRNMFGMVLQDSFLYTGTIAENIAYGKENATKEEIIAAAKSAYAHGFITRLPFGYDTVVTGNGENLSQGQRQLLCIARVMLINPPMLILDEATSNIDTLTELRVQKAFAKMMSGKTSFVVAHRLSTIKESDKILVMKDGNIIEQGSHTELLAQKGFYSTLYNSQFAKS